MSTSGHARHGFMALNALALALALTLGCEAADVAGSIEEEDLPLEVWDFSEGMVAEKANWGAGLSDLDDDLGGVVFAPWQNGRVERLFRTVKEVLRQRAVRTGNDTVSADDLRLVRTCRSAVSSCWS